MGHTPPVILGDEVDPDTFYEEYDASPIFAAESSKYSRPEIVFVDDNPTHIWIDDSHLVETDDRRLRPGKHILTVTGTKTLYEVTEVRDSDKFDVTSVPDHIDDVEDPADEIVLETTYDFESGLLTSGTQSFPRYQYETEEVLSMGDAPPLVFEPQNE